jgi:hypothetical protein
MTAVRATKLYDVDITSLEERISRIERNGVTVAPSAQENKVETEQKKNNDRPMDALGIWGRLTTYFRRNESMTYYSIAGDQNKVKIENKNLVVEANSTDYDTMLSQSFRDAVQRALDDDGVDLNFVVERKQTGIDMDKETVRMKKLAGSVKFNVIRK